MRNYSTHVARKLQVLKPLYPPVLLYYTVWLFQNSITYASICLTMFMLLTSYYDNFLTFQWKLTYPYNITLTVNVGTQT